MTSKFFVDKQELEHLHSFRKRINTLAWLHNTWVSRVHSNQLPPFVHDYKKLNEQTYKRYLEYYKMLIDKYAPGSALYRTVIDENTGEIKEKAP